MDDKDTIISFIWYLTIFAKIKFTCVMCCSRKKNVRRIKSCLTWVYTQKKKKNLRLLFLSINIWSFYMKEHFLCQLAVESHNNEVKVPTNQKTRITWSLNYSSLRLKTAAYVSCIFNSKTRVASLHFFTLSDMLFCIQQTQFLQPFKVSQCVGRV